jgi:hypothetical protein
MSLLIFNGKILKTQLGTSFKLDHIQSPNHLI